MSARARRRHRRSGRKKNPFLLAMVVLGAILAKGVMSFGVYVLAVAAETPPLSELKPVGQGANCSGSQQLATVRRLSPDPQAIRKMLYGNAARLLSGAGR